MIYRNLGLRDFSENLITRAEDFSSMCKRREKLDVSEKTDNRRSYHESMVPVQLVRY